VRDAERQDVLSKRIAREIDIPRISVFTVEKFENTLVQLFQVPGIERVWLQPTNYYIDEQLKVTLFHPEGTSLFQLLHGDALSNGEGSPQAKE
jgi:hypothetical protein